MAIVMDVYKLTESFPAEGNFGLTSQMQCCTVRKPSNIVEGATRNTQKEFINFLNISQGSLAELDNQLEISGCLKFINREFWINMYLKSA